MSYERAVDLDPDSILAGAYGFVLGQQIIS